MPRNSIAVNIRTIQRSLRTLDHALRRLAVSVQTVSAQKAPANRATPAKRTLKLSPARKAALKLQGQYMGHMRKLAAKEKAEVKALKAAKGIRPAIARAKQLGAA